MNSDSKLILIYIQTHNNLLRVEHLQYVSVRRDHEPQITSYYSHMHTQTHIL